MSVFSIADLRDRAKSNGTRYVEVEVWDGKLRLGTLCSAAVLVWVGENEDDRFKENSGLRLLARSIVDAEGNRVSDKAYGTEEEQAEITEFVTSLREKDAEDNGKAVLAALKLNNLLTAKLREKLKNDSGETTTDGQPSVSP
jgi:hypothetical protein